MIRRLECTDAESNKFWEIDVSGKTFTVHCGRIGTDGRRSTCCATFRCFSGWTSADALAAFKASLSAV